MSEVTSTVLTNLQLLDALIAVVGPTNVLTGDDVSARAMHIWDATPMVAKAIVRPANTAETAAVLKICHDAGQAVVTHGGVTGLVDGHRSTATDIVLSLEKQNAIESLDATGRTITVQAGAILQQVQAAASDAQLQLGLDLGARGSCTIGGNLSTNAGGYSVLRYGMAREQVLGLEVVLANGSVLTSMNRMMKNNAGYDLKHLFIGSEGTLGIITKAVLRLRVATPVVHTALLAFESSKQVAKTLALLDSELNGTLDAFEVIWQPFYKLNTNPDTQGARNAPLSRDFPVYAIVESRSSAGRGTEEIFQNALEKALSKELIVDAALAQSEKERTNIWYVREHFDLVMKHDPLFIYDISLPIVDMDSYVRKLTSSLESIWPNVIVYVYGHLADGNLHILVAPPVADAPPGTEQLQQWRELSDSSVYQPLQALGGSISAEHGIGLSKKAYLSLSRTSEEIALMRILKITLDPAGILNPGKII